MRPPRRLSAALSLSLTLLAIPVLGLVVAAAPAQAVVAGPWPGGTSVTTVDNASELGNNMSGLVYQGTGSTTRGTLWAVRNGPSTLHKLTWNGTSWSPANAGGWVKQLRFPDGTGVPDAEGVTITDSGSSGGVYVSSERNDIKDNNEDDKSRLSVLRYDVSGPGAELAATREWNLTSLLLPAVGDNSGLEAITWVPDSYLVGHGFKDQTGAVYAPAAYSPHGGGIFLVGVEGTGMIHAVALGDAGDSALVASFSSGLIDYNGKPTVMDLQFESETQQLWASCDNNCKGQVGRFAVDTAAGATQGQFVARSYVDRPSGMPDLNNEGLSISPAASCVGGLKPVWWADDSGTNGHALREGTISCSSTGVPPGTDTTAPVVTITGVKAGATYLGAAPGATCSATDAVSGVVGCTIVTTRAKKATTLVATAKDAAGNTGTASVTYSTLLSFVAKSTLTKGKFAAKRGKKAVVLTYVASGTPKLLLPGAKAGPKMKKAGTSGKLTIFKAKVMIPRSLRGTSYVLTIKTSAGKDKVKIKVTGKK
jgi:hypothetical protein